MSINGNHDNHEEIELDTDTADNPAPQYYTARSAIAPSKRFKISDDGKFVPAEVLSTDKLSITITDYDNDFYAHDNEFGIVDSDVGEHASDEESEVDEDDEDAVDDAEGEDVGQDDVDAEEQESAEADEQSEASSNDEAEDEEADEQPAAAKPSDDDSGPDELPVVAWPSALQSATNEFNIDLTINTAPETALDETPLPSDTPTPPTSSTSTQAQEPTLSKRALKRQRKKLREQEGQQQPQSGKRQRTATNSAMPSFFQHKPIAATDSSSTEVISRKYWGQRYSYWSKFDLGIKMDSVGWYSVTPEAIAKHQAERCRCDTIIDAFAGVGGNAIAFAQTCMHVIAIEIDPVRLACAKHNARVYGVADRIEFILGSYYDLIPKLKADVVFLSPPWGGPSYIQSDVFDIATMIPNNGVELYQRTKVITSNICYCLPRNCDRAQIESLAALPVTHHQQSTEPTVAGSVPPASDEPVAVDIEENMSNGRVKMLTVYYDLLAADGGAEAVEVVDDAPEESSATAGGHDDSDDRLHETQQPITLPTDST